MARKWAVLYRRVQIVLERCFECLPLQAKASNLRVKVAHLLAVLGLVVAIALHGLMPVAAGERSLFVRDSQSHSTLLLAEGELADSPENFAAVPPVLTASNLVCSEAEDCLQQGKALYSAGQFQAALEVWERAERLYRDKGMGEGAIGSKINQSIALQKLGRYREAKQRLVEAQAQISESSKLLKATLLLSLGNIYQGVGALSDAQETFQKSLELAQGLKDLKLISQILLSLGNNQRAFSQKKREELTLKQIEDTIKFEKIPREGSQEIPCLINKESELTTWETYAAARQCYQEAASQAVSEIDRVQAQLNQISLIAEIASWWEKQATSLRLNSPRFLQDLRSNAQNLSARVQGIIEKLSGDRLTVQAQINLAQSLARLQPNDAGTRKEIEQLLTAAIAQSRTWQDKRTESYALGKLAESYAQAEKMQDAETLTSEALAIAQSLQAWDIAYQFQRQLGKIHLAQGKREEAIRDYTVAVNTIQNFRQNNLVGIDAAFAGVNTDIQSYFQENLEPIYRELVDLLLAGQGREETPDQNITKALSVIELMQVAELENFLGCDLGEESRDESALSGGRRVEEAQREVEKELKKIHQFDPKAALIYPILLKNRIEVILSLPGQPLQHYSTKIPDIEIKDAVQQLRKILPDPMEQFYVKDNAKNLYQWFIKPLQDKLSGLETLVFGIDTPLRNIPMSVLYNESSKKYLVENYNLAILPRLQLKKSQSLTGNIEALTAGLSEVPPGETSSPLPHVAEELQSIKNIVSTTQLVNQNFTKINLRQEMNAKPFPVVHLATHGTFSSQPAKTFILVWKDQIKVSELTDLLRARQRITRVPIELLVLSACQTAEGDARATLGLAGVAVRAGARSTVGSLWSVYDQSTADFMGKFYQKLQEGETKAKALRNAQLYLLKEQPNPEFKKPRYWAPFILVGNWQK
ncbi:MAG: CHAT domain-containing protein [Actinomycetota bacterium]